MILIDSDVLIWFTRGHEGARTRLAQIKPWPKIIKNKDDRYHLHGARPGLPEQDGTAVPEARFNAAAYRILPLTPAISDRAMGLVDKHALSDGLRLADAMIAATAIEHTLTLLTGNAQIQGLMVEHFGP